jgi:hypothetical protein
LRHFTAGSVTVGSAVALVPTSVKATVVCGVYVDGYWLNSGWPAR